MTTRQPQGRSTTQADCRWHGGGQVRVSLSHTCLGGDWIFGRRMHRTLVLEVVASAVTLARWFTLQRPAP